MTVTVTSAAVLPTYARQDVTLVSGEGAWLVDADGTRYLDFVAGIAVVGLGHRHPAPLAAAQAQLDRLWHASNLYWTEPMALLAERLSDRFGGARAFFCNSGAETIEAALKYARKATGKAGVVALEGSFHGRTFGALAATGQPGKRRPFEPVVPGIRFAEPNDLVSLAAAATKGTGCILLEPVQGEGGIHPLEPSFVAAARGLAPTSGSLDDGTMLFEPELHEPLTEDAWDEDRARDSIRRIVADADASFDSDRLWPAEEWDAYKTTPPLKDLYVGSSGVLWALDVLAFRGLAETRIDLAAAAARTLEAWRERPDFDQWTDIPSQPE